MSEIVPQDTALKSESGDILASPGALIREAREASGVHVDVLAAALKITVDRLEALEADHYAALPDMVFARALSSSACRILKIDPTSVLVLMPKNQAQYLPVGRAHINESIHDEKQSRSLFVRQLTRPLGVAVMVLLVGAGVLFFLPERGDSPEILVVAPAQALAAVEANENVPLTLLMPNAQDLDGRTTTVQSASVASAGDAVDANGADIPAEEATAVGTSSISMDGLLEFRAREATWVQVRDATKAVVFERTLTKGASASATGMLPLSVVIGRADSTDVFVRGKPFALTLVAKENVARFEVK